MQGHGSNGQKLRAMCLSTGRNLCECSMRDGLGPYSVGAHAWVSTSLRLSRPSSPIFGCPMCCAPGMLFFGKISAGLDLDLYRAHIVHHRMPILQVSRGRGEDRKIGSNATCCFWMPATRSSVDNWLNSPLNVTP